MDVVAGVDYSVCNHRSLLGGEGFMMINGFHTIQAVIAAYDLAADAVESFQDCKNLSGST